MAENMFFEVTVTILFDQQKPVSSFLPDLKKLLKGFYEIWRSWELEWKYGQLENIPTASMGAQT